MTVQKIAIEFLYLDLDTCDRCKGTDTNLEAALSEVSHILESAGIRVSVTKTQVKSKEQARALRFISSPTIRVNGKDIALEFRESHCQSCTTGCDTPINCRVWVFQGREYTETPKAMIIDAILREVYAGQPKIAHKKAPYKDVPDNIKHFLVGKKHKK